MSDKPAKKPWFAPKRLGYGASLPIRWQGWVLLIGYIAATMAAMSLMFALLPQAYAAPCATAISMLLTAAFVWIVRDRTEGGWRWRNGRQ